MNTQHPTCARQSIKFLMRAVVIWAAAGAFFEYWDRIHAGLKLLIAAGGFWHTFALLAVGTIAASYMNCCNQQEGSEGINDGSSIHWYAGLYAGLLALAMVVAGLFATYIYWQEIYVPFKCTKWFCEYEWRPWRAVAMTMQIAVALRAFVAPTDRGLSELIPE